MLVHEGITFSKEYYFAILMDRAFGGPVIVASPSPSMNSDGTSQNPCPLARTASVYCAIGVSP